MGTNPTKNNEIVHRFLHGDMHKGNWKIRINKSEIKLVVYDFGFCWRLPSHISGEVGNNINNSFLKILLNYECLDKANRMDDESIIDLFCDSSYLLLNKYCDKDIIRNEILKIRENSDIRLNDPLFLLRLIINAIRNNNIIIDSYIIQSLILHNQLSDNISKNNSDLCNYNIGNIDEAIFFFYDKHIRFLITYCDSMDTFKEYSAILSEEIELNCKKQYKIDDPIISINFEKFKNLAIH
jgi:hypothetical protein